MKSFLFVLIAVFAINVSAVEVPKNLINAIAQVESKGKSNAVGDNGKAIGKFQMWKVYVDEVNRINTLKKSQTVFQYEDRLNPEKSEEMVRIYLSFWGDKYEKNTGNKATLEVLAKIHNGHTFWKRSAKNKKNTQYFKNLNQYWTKVKKELDK